ncbi:MAG: cupin domain-containing protein [Candidatus Kapabacteria bacterium]|nr:cupin domain-containing protein [Candidatus Kapabacteria bacterium]
MTINNLYKNISQFLADELFETIINNDSFHLERIVSVGHSTALEQWYDQEKTEWVILLKGAAGIRFEDSDKIFELNPGDYLQINAHCKHRVEWTSPDEETVWLALHF